MSILKVWKNTKKGSLNCVLGIKNFFSNAKYIAADRNKTNTIKTTKESGRERHKQFILVPLTNRE
jgi:hypothetical protein